jgi:hypothetical protein
MSYSAGRPITLKGRQFKRNEPVPDEFLPEPGKVGSLVRMGFLNHVAEGAERSAPPTPAPETAAAVETETVSVTDETVDLESLTKAELVDLADERGVEVPSKATKSDIIEALGG